MCGIAGFTGIGNQDTIMAMIQAIRYRGPNAQHTYIDNDIALGHARLAILDIRPEGNCPMFTKNRDLVITFNGEIYNYQILKTELKNKYSFNTNTDTEVLLYLYKEYGVKMLEKITGMFAFAIYDFENKELFLARDRMGKKPLYYTCTNNSFVFGSELKAVLKHPEVKNQINLEAVNQFLTFDYIPTPSSIIQNIYKLEAAHYLVVKNNTLIQKKAYWHHSFLPKLNITWSDAKTRLDNLLETAVQRRLMSDVPLGIFLSGGLDSSTVAYYAQKNSSSKIKTFSIGFEDKSYDEADYAVQVAHHLNTEHHSQILTPKATIELIEEIYPMVDEPFADASLIPTYFLSKFTRQHVTVALGGDGSDELLAGYPTFISNYFTQPFASFPKSWTRGLLRIFQHLLPSSDKNISLDFKINQFLRGFQGKENEIHQLWLGSFLPDEKEKLFRSDVYQDLKNKDGLEIINYHFGNVESAWSDFDKLIYYYCHTYLLDDILVKIDRASMYNSLEVRAPFLDTDLVQFLHQLPKKFLQNGLTSKYILKKLMEDKLPRNIVYRPKKGFGIPVSDWIRKDIKQQVGEILFERDELFNAHYIEKLWNEHQSKKFNHRKLLWNLFMFKYWHLIYAK
ncbi:MAG: asparagine synthase (glutamine-hydrolyzing) [Chitinophagales bacterium]|nr:asparagine synthase (glutamine-hydrolyzing) [Chitinophagales bacterium]